ncbi:TetR/AcrR family transcriptional regulator [Streptomyces eurythermus]|uniref:TetR/AcrR family transcriptional regulator n=1 Tax=Streptomyces eurythermus TaxID=42237 RepID=UPI0033E5EF5C
MCRVAGRRMQEDHGLRMAGCRSRGVRSRRRHRSPRAREGRRSRQPPSRWSEAADAGAQAPCPAGRWPPPRRRSFLSVPRISPISRAGGAPPITGVPLRLWVDTTWRAIPASKPSEGFVPKSAAGPAPRPTRADARRGYDRIVAAAESLVAEHGAEASLEEIARHADVGSATLHRRFPSRQLLLEAVFKGRVEALCAKAHDLLPAPDPGPHSSPGSAPSARTPSPTGDWERPSCTAHATATHHREQPPATQ